MSTDVFISYDPNDSQFATQLYQDLTGRGLSAWFDQKNLSPTDHRGEAIVTAIDASQVFLLVLSPAAVQSKEIRQTVDLAQDKSKKIVPLIWQQTTMPAAFEFALAGTQRIDFNGTASPENFEQLGQVLIGLIGGNTLDAILGNISIAVEPIAPAVPQESASTPEPAAEGGRKLGGERRLGGGRRLGGPQFKYNPIAIYLRVMSKVITAADLGLGTEDEDFLNNELKWLFNAANLLYQIQRGEAELTSPVAVTIPEETERTATANNSILPPYRDQGLVKDAVKGLESNLQAVTDYLRQLELLVTAERNGGEEAKRNIALQHQINDQRLDLVKTLEMMAATMKFYFDVNITAPRELKALLQEEA
jgi:hypothetical protein